jgi:integrase
MSKSTIKIVAKTVAEAVRSDKEYFIWDAEIRGLGLRVPPTGEATFVYQYRIGRRARRMKIGPAQVIKVASARAQAQEWAVFVAQGGDPLARKEAERNAVTVRQLSQSFDDFHIGLALKDSTAREYRRALNNYILPALGAMKVAEVDRRAVSKLFLSMSDKPTQANRTLEIVSKMFNLAEEWGQRPMGSNPRRGIKKYPETRRERFFSPAELARIGEVLEEMEAERIELPSAIAAIRLLILSGCRLNEIMTLQWTHVQFNAGILKLPDSKTGKKDVPLGQAALDLLSVLPRLDGNPWVLPGRNHGGRLTDLQPFWQRVRARAGLKDARIHDLRHTFASVAVASGKSLPMIGRMLGHKTVQSTARYAHLANGTVRDAADDVTALIASSLASRSSNGGPAVPVC